MQDCLPSGILANTGEALLSPYGLLVLGLVLIACAALIFTLAHRSKGRWSWNRRSSFRSFVAVGVIAVSFGLAPSSYAASGCTSGQGSTSNPPTLIAAANDIFKPVGTFPTSSPYYYGWTLSQVYDTATSSYQWLFGDGTTERAALTLHVVGNDTGSLDPATVDLDPNTPGIQREVLLVPPGSIGWNFALKYTYDPATDTLTVVGAFDEMYALTAGSSGYTDAYNSYQTNYYDTHGTWPSASDQAAFNLQWITDHGTPVLVTLYVPIDGATENLTPAGYNPAYAYEVHVPYTVQSIGGTASTGAEIIVPVVQPASEPQ